MPIILISANSEDSSLNVPNNETMFSYEPNIYSGVIALPSIVHTNTIFRIVRISGFFKNRSAGFFSDDVPSNIKVYFPDFSVNILSNANYDEGFSFPIRRISTPYYSSQSIPQQLKPNETLRFTSNVDLKFDTIQTRKQIRVKWFFTNSEGKVIPIVISSLLQIILEYN